MHHLAAERCTIKAITKVVIPQRSLHFWGQRSVLNARLQGEVKVRPSMQTNEGGWGELSLPELYIPELEADVIVLGHLEHV